MSWNHRVVRLDIGTPNERLEICEVYYDADHIPYAHTAQGIGISGETLEEVVGTLARMIRCVDHPILDEIPTGDDRDLDTLNRQSLPNSPTTPPDSDSQHDSD